MKLLVGLGNPGNRYKYTRHNVGFYLLDKFGYRQNLKYKKHTKYQVAEYKNLFFMKPMTYMNLSGVAVTSFKTKYRFDDVMVVVDDINLPLGFFRIRENGGNGGHNGLKSISRELGNTNYKRIRIGVGKPQGEIDQADYVLSKFSEDEIKIIDSVYPFFEELIKIYSEYGFKEMLDYSSKNKPILNSIV